MRSSNRPMPRNLLPTMWLLIALCVTGVDQHAMAQGTLGSVADPIATRELEMYADRLGLSRQQRQAIQSLHDEYRAEFQQLRETDIESFLNSSRGLGGGFGMIMNRDATSKALRQLSDIQNRIQALDNRLFDQVQTLLTDEQVSKLTLVRQARERVRLRAGLSRITAFINPAQHVDLAELAYELRLSAAERAAIEPVLASYETTLTASARRVNDLTLSMTRDLLDRVQAEQINEESMRNPERRGQLFQTFRTVLSDMQRELAAKAGEISDLNRRTLRTLGDSLEPPQARTLREQFYQRAYPEIGSGGGSTSRAFDIVLKFEELTDDQRTAITALAAEFESSLQRIMEQMMDLIDENRRTQSFLDFDQDSRRQFQEKLSEHRERRSKLNESALASLRAALQPELLARLDKRLGETANVTEQREGIAITMTGSGNGIAFSAARVERQEGEAASAIGNDPFIPNPISRRDLETYAARLGVPNEQRPILSSLHDDYTEAYRAIEAAEIQAVREAERQLWSMNGGQVTPPTPEAIDDLYQKRQQAFNAMVALDSRFFEDLQIALGLEETDGRIARLRQSRQRAVYSRAAGQGGMMGISGGRFAARGGPGGRDRVRGMFFGGRETTVDLSTIIDAAQLTPTDAEAFNAALSQYEASATAAFQKLYETSLRLQQVRDKMTAQTTRARNADNDDRQRNNPWGEGFRRLMENEGQAAEDARRSIADLNRQTLISLAATLPDTQAQQLRRAYNRQAYPGVFDDPRSAQRHLDAAMSLADLTDQQRSQLQDLVFEFTSQYETLSDRMVEMAAQSAAPGERRDRDWQAFQEQLRTRERLDFERDDLNDKTLARLRSILNEQQIQQLGGLEMPSNDE